MSANAKAAATRCIVMHATWEGYVVVDIPIDSPVIAFGYESCNIG
jgi:hypothetical protein